MRQATCTPSRQTCRILIRALAATLGVALAWPAAVPRAGSAAQTSRTWPQAYTVARNQKAGTLALRTPFYVVEHDLKQGGAIKRITLTNGKAANLLVRPLETCVRDESGALLSDLGDPAPRVTQHREGLNEIVTVDSALTDEKGRASALRVRTTLQYRWGYIKIRKEFLGPADMRVREVCPVSAAVAPSLSEFGYREGKTEDEGAAPFAFGSNVWGRLRAGQPSDGAVQARYVPRSVLLADPGVEGIEWFAASDLTQWDLQLSGRRGQARFLLQPSPNPPGLALSIAAYADDAAAVVLPRSCVFDFYLAVPILDGRARRPWLHRSFNRNRGAWVSEEEIRHWAEQGLQTIHCHNDGDYYDDGLFWRDGAYPPYPDMDRYDKILKDCRRAGIRTATYFSNKELHPSTREFQEQGTAWGRMDRKGELRHNRFRNSGVFGAQMCLRSGWFDFLKFSIKRVLENHPLDGVYYDWNTALFCSNPRHEAKGGAAASAGGHWDIDELLQLMEWTRNGVGKDGLIIIHNTTTPMFATENFADYVVATEWGYRKWTGAAPDMKDLPLEWSLVGAVPRGVIYRSILSADASRELHRLFALEAFLGGAAPWPVSDDAYALNRLLQPLGDTQSYRFADWRNRAVSLSDPRCAAAVYSRPGEAWLLVANLDQKPRDVTCVLHPEKLPCALKRAVRASIVDRSGAGEQSDGRASILDARRLLSEGVQVSIPGAEAVLIHVREEER